MALAAKSKFLVWLTPMTSSVAPVIPLRAAAYRTITAPGRGSLPLRRGSRFRQRAGIHAEDRIRWANANQAGKNQYDAYIAPSAYRPCQGQGDQGDSGGDPQEPVDCTYVDFHGDSPRFTIIEIRNTTGRRRG
jgi:hypothetical protein